VILGDDLLDALAVTMSTKDGYRTINFTSLGVIAEIELKTRAARIRPKTQFPELIAISSILSTNNITPILTGGGTPTLVVGLPPSEAMLVPSKTEVTELRPPVEIAHRAEPVRAVMAPSRDEELAEMPEIRKIPIPILFESKDPSPRIGPKWEKLLRNVWNVSVGEYPVLAMPEGQGPMVTEVTRIPVTPGPPVVVPNYRSALVEKSFIRGKVRELLTKGIIKRTRSEWNSPILVVPKAGEEKFRLVVDYRRLNKRIAGDTYPLPHIEDLLTKTSEARVFSKIDLVSGFHQIPVHEEDQHYLAFTALDDSYTYCYVPFGLNIAPALFTRALNRALVRCQEYTAVYVDDILVYSASIDEHLTHLSQVFESLGKANFRVSMKKSTLGVDTIMYLGHILTPGQITQDPEKVKAVREFPIPMTVKGVRRFLGMCGYYRRFIKGFSKIATPLTELTSGRGKVNLNLEQVAAFTALRNAMTQAPVLELFVFSRDARVEVDSCSTGVGAVLTQEVHGAWKPVAFYSKKFPATAKVYASREAETYGIYLAIVHWRVWLLGREFTIVSDHQSLVLSDHGRNSRRIQRWLLGLSEFKFGIRYRRGLMHSAPNALSRIWREREEEGVASEPEQHLLVTEELEDGEIPPDELPYYYALAQEGKEEVVEPEEADTPDQPMDPIEELTTDEVLVFPTKEEWGKATLRCRQLAPIAKVLTKEDEKFVDRIEAKKLIDKYHLVLNDGVILDSKGLKWVPEELRMNICALFHATPFSMHHDARRTLALLTRVVYWPGVDHYVKSFVKSCHECRVVKGRTQWPDLEVRQVEPIPFQVVAIDHAGPLPTSRYGRKYILVAVDMFSGYPAAVPVASLKKDITAKALIQIFSIFGWPRTILSDNGGSFRNDVLDELCRLSGVKHRFTITRHPQANGAAERLVKTIKTAMDVLGVKHNSKWEDQLDMILLGIRQTPRAPLWLSPSQIVFGQQMRGPAEAALDFDREIELAPVAHWVFERIKSYREVRLLLSEQQERQRKERAEKDPVKVQIAIRPGDLVLTFNPDKLLSDTRGLRVRWVGPHVVHRQVSQSSYQIYEKGVLRIHHQSRLIPYDDTGLKDDHPMKDRCQALHKEYKLFLRKLAIEAKKMDLSEELKAVEAKAEEPVVPADGPSAYDEQDAAEEEGEILEPPTTPSEGGSDLPGPEARRGTVIRPF